MKKILVLGAATAMSFGAAAADMSWGGYAQIEGKSGEGTNSSTTGRGMKFDQGLVRFIAKADGTRHYGKVQMDFHHTNGAVAKDIILGYKGNKFANFRVGKMKEPLGMEFNEPGHARDFVDSGYTQALGFGRMVGGQLYGDLVAGLSYNLFFGNPNNDGQNGTDNLYGINLAYDRNTFHFQAGLGIDEDASNNLGGEDVKLTNVAARYGLGALTLKAEYMKKELGVYSWSSIYAHVGYKFADNMEFAVRHFINNETDDTVNKVVESDISNTWLGFNYWVDKAARFQFNYVLVSGDDRDTKSTTSGTTTTQAWDESGAFTANAFLAQYQVKF